MEIEKDKPDAHLLEIDKEFLKSVYKNKEIKKNYFEIIEKKVIFSRNESKKENNYYSDFKSFRNYLTSGFESEQTNNEIKEINKLLDSSKSLRDSVIDQYSIKRQEKKDNISLSSANAFSKAIMQKKVVSSFTKKCKLLTVKANDSKTLPSSPKFKFFSELQNPSDLQQAPNEFNLENKMLSFKKKLTKSHYQEEQFSNFAKNYHINNNINGNKLMESQETNKEKSTKESTAFKKKLPNEYVDSIFRQRGSEAFILIDSFMSNHNVTHKNNQNEKDLYENIYEVLSKFNNSNFMSYLYTKNKFFKFVFDEFSQNPKENLNNVDLSRIVSIESEKFFKNEEENSQKFKSPERGRKSTLRRNCLNLEDYYASYFLDKVCYTGEKIDSKTVETFLNENLSNLSTEILQSIKSSLINLLKGVLNKDYNYILVINKNEKLRIINNNEDESFFNKQFSEIEEDVKKVRVFKIDKKFILDKFASITSLHKDQNFNNLFWSVNSYYIIEVRNKQETNMKTVISSYYLVRITNENIERFDQALNQLKMFNSYESRIVIPEPKPVIEEEKKPKKITKEKKKVSAYEDDFLGIANDDILKDVLYSKSITKKDDSLGKIEDHLDQGFDFRNLIDKEHKKIEINPSFNTQKNMSLISQEINFKENYMFRINNQDYKFTFSDINGQICLSYYRYTSEDDSSLNKTIIALSDIKDYVVVIEEGKDYYPAIIKFRFNDTTKSPLEIISFVKNDYSKFIAKIDNYVKKGI